MHNYFSFFLTILPLCNIQSLYHHIWSLRAIFRFQSVSLFVCQSDCSKYCCPQLLPCLSSPLGDGGTNYIQILTDLSKIQLLTWTFSVVLNNVVVKIQTVDYLGKVMIPFFLDEYYPADGVSVILRTCLVNSKRSSAISVLNVELS